MVEFNKFVAKTRTVISRQ